MKIETKNGNVHLVGVKNFDLAQTFDCGQCFRFNEVKESRHEKEFSGVAFGRFLSFGQDGSLLTVYNCTKDFFEEKLYSYLGLCDDYEAIRSDILSKCPTEYMLSVAKYGEGIRILRQEKWETLCSFIISQNNNIPRIKKIIRTLCETYGENGAFPTADASRRKDRTVRKYSRKRSSIQFGGAFNVGRVKIGKEKKR